ncbi:Holliday junction resolvase [Candidatus Woesearchaeota archaeon]|nr:Holliday junction resolvase [Candidatus Woesearchaeota archaeon]
MRIVNLKAKGTRGERELVKFFNEAGWVCIRVAGSGSSRYPAPDLLAGNAMRRLAIECKMVGNDKKYFDRDEIDQLQMFARKFGAESWIGIRFPTEKWHFLMLEDLEKTGTCWAISVELAKRRGLIFEELIGEGKLLQPSEENRNI